MRTALPWFVAAAVLGVLLVAPGRADISVEQAAALVEAKMGVSVKGWYTTIEVGGDGDTHIRFHQRPQSADTPQYWVNATTGQFTGWSASPPASPSERAPTEEVARSAALAAARKALGPEAEGLQWRVTVTSSTADVEGRMPPCGDPPRRGLRPEVSLSLLGDGSVNAYGQYVPTEADRVPLPVSVTQDQAVEIAWAADTGPRKDLIGADLEQRRGKVYWKVHLGDVDVARGGADPKTRKYPGVRFRIDAQTGKVLDVNRERGASGEQQRHAAPWPGIAGAALLCLAVVTVLAWRGWRRRERQGIGVT